MEHNYEWGLEKNPANYTSLTPLDFSFGIIYQEDEKKGSRLYSLLRIFGALFFLVYKKIFLNKKKDAL